MKRRLPVLKTNTLEIIATIAILFALTQPAGAAAKKVVLNDAVLLVTTFDDPGFTRSETRHEVRKRNKTYRLKFQGKEPEGLLTGQKVKTLKGKLMNARKILVGSEAESFQLLERLEAAAVSGIRQAVVLIIKSATSVTSATPAKIASAMLQVDTWYRESSYQQLSMKNDLNNDGTGDVYTVTIPDSSAGIGESSAFTFCRTAQNLAPSQVGIDPSPYNHVLCVLPPDMNYSWYGQAYVGGREVVISGTYAGGYPGGDTHEIGHNLGLGHSNTPPNVEYGESGCVMGGNAGTGRRDFNGPHKTRMGWIGIVSAGNGTYELSAVEAQPAQRVSSNIALKLRDAVAAEDLYISYRAPLGTFGPGLNQPYKTSVHSYSGYTSILLASLGDGQSFSRNGIVITQAAHTSTSATVQIGVQCAGAAPGLSLSPTSQVTNILEARHYTLTVTNKDVNCSDAVSYALSAALPSTGWSANLSSASLVLSPGQSGSVGVDITPPAEVISGSYTFSLTALAAGHPSSTSSGTYLIDNIAPSQITDLRASSPRKGKVLLQWSSPSDVGSGLAGYDIFRNGTQLISVTTNQYTDSPGNGTFTYQVLARDKAGNKSAQSNSVQVTVSTTGKPKK